MGRHVEIFSDMVCRVPFEGESMLDLRNAIVACQYKAVNKATVDCMIPLLLPRV